MWVAPPGSIPNTHKPNWVQKCWQDHYTSLPAHLHPLSRLYRVYQKEVNSLKNESKLKNMKYLVKFYFNHINLYLIFPQLQNHWCVTVNKSIVATFVSQAKMQLRQVSKNQKSFEINLRVWRHSVRSRWVCMKSEVSSRACVTFRRYDEYAWGQRLGYFVRGQNAIGGHTCTRIDL